MRIGVFGSDGHPWAAAARALGHTAISIPGPSLGQPGRPEWRRDLDLPQRFREGERVHKTLRDAPPDALLDIDGQGLLFVSGEQESDGARLLHEVLRCPLISIWMSPLTELFPKLDAGLLVQCLRTGAWIKCLYDSAAAKELDAFGFPNVVNLSPAAADFDYPAAVPSDAWTSNGVAFFGDAGERVLKRGAGVDGGSLVPGIMALLAQADAREVSFTDAYSTLFRFGQVPSPEEDPIAAAKKILKYLEAKQSFIEIDGLRRRDRFVIALARALGERFKIHGRGWSELYGFPETPAPADLQERVALYRRAPICVALSDGFRNTGLAPVHFEIAAAGGFLLCYEQPEVHHAFDVGEECVCFTHEKELLEHVAYYIEHAEERRRIAQAGQARALSQHLRRHRLNVVLELLRTAEYDDSETTEHTPDQAAHALV